MRSGRTSGSTCGCNGDSVWQQRSEVGHRSTTFDLREAWDSLHDDIELRSLTGTNGNSRGLTRRDKNIILSTKPRHINLGADFIFFILMLDNLEMLEFAAF